MMGSARLTPVVSFSGGACHPHTIGANFTPNQNQNIYKANKFYVLYEKIKHKTNKK